MSAWPEDEFQRVALSTKLAKRTIEACHQVLVLEQDGSVVAKALGLFPAQISRGIGILKEKQAELVESVENMRDSTQSLREFAIEEAKALVRGDWGVKDGVQGERYEGLVIMRTPGFVVQKVARDLVVHDLGRLQEVPVMTKPQEIDYPADGGKASVRAVPRRANERAADKDSGRGGR
jgi:hypothetical protein